MNASFWPVCNRGRATLLVLLLVIAIQVTACGSSLPISTTPSFVLGQPNLTTGVSGTSQTQVNTPGSIAMDDQGGLYVADTNSSRVLHFPASCLSNRTNGCAANFVLGQPDFTTGVSGTSQTQLNAPTSVAVDGQSGLYVADLGNNRVLHFPASCLSNRTNGCAADFVLGQPDFSSNNYGTSQTQLNAPSSVAVDGHGGLYVADMSNNRIVYFPPSGS